MGYMAKKQNQDSPEFTFKVGSKVFYPTHGAGTIKAKKKIEFQGKKNEYFEFKFIDAQLTVSTPVENVYNLGIRPILSPKEINDKISILKKKPTSKPKGNDYNEIIGFIQELDEQGDIDAFISVIQACNYVSKKRTKEGRLIPVSITKHLRTAVSHIAAEMALTNDITLEKAEEKFTKLTGIEVK